MIVHPPTRPVTTYFNDFYPNRLIGCGENIAWSSWKLHLILQHYSKKASFFSYIIRFHKSAYCKYRNEHFSTEITENGCIQWVQ